MRLLNTRTLQLETFVNAPPRYAILSHTWGKDEVLFDDVNVNANANANTSNANIHGTFPNKSPRINDSNSSSRVKLPQNDHVHRIYGEDSLGDFHNVHGHDYGGADTGGHGTHDHEFAQDFSPFPHSQHHHSRTSTHASAIFHNEAYKRWSHKAGASKVRGCCKEAARRGLEYAWIDSCCIDKLSSSELSESINSMFAWYAAAAVCLVFLEDVDSTVVRPGEGGKLELGELDGGRDGKEREKGREDEGKESAKVRGEREFARQLRAARWFTRGWTLQELLAPANVRFYDKEWRFFATRHELARLLANVTGIPQAVMHHGHAPFPHPVEEVLNVPVLLRRHGTSHFSSGYGDSPAALAAMAGGYGQSQQMSSVSPLLPQPTYCPHCGSEPWRDVYAEGLASFSVAQRMSWAARRTTTREEDIAYCLFGLFDINIPLLYGEGSRRAFERLQVEVIARHDDQSILAFNTTGSYGWVESGGSGRGRKRASISSSSAFMGGMSGAANTTRLLAPSPRAFADSDVHAGWDFRLSNSAVHRPRMSVADGDLVVEVRLARISGSANSFVGILDCSKGEALDMAPGIMLRLIGGGEVDLGGGPVPFGNFGGNFGGLGSSVSGTGGGSNGEAVFFKTGDVRVGFGIGTSGGGREKRGGEKRLARVQTWNGGAYHSAGTVDTNQSPLRRIRIVDRAIDRRAMHFYHVSLPPLRIRFVDDCDASSSGSQYELEHCFPDRFTTTDRQANAGSNAAPSTSSTSLAVMRPAPASAIGLGFAAAAVAAESSRAGTMGSSQYAGEGAMGIAIFHKPGSDAVVPRFGVMYRWAPVFSETDSVFDLNNGNTEYEASCAVFSFDDPKLALMVDFSGSTPNSPVSVRKEGGLGGVGASFSHVPLPYPTGSGVGFPYDWDPPPASPSADESYVYPTPFASKTPNPEHGKGQQQKHKHTLSLGAEEREKRRDVKEKAGAAAAREVIRSARSGVFGAAELVRLEDFGVGEQGYEVVVLEDLGTGGTGSSANNIGASPPPDRPSQVSFNLTAAPTTPVTTDTGGSTIFHKVGGGRASPGTPPPIIGSPRTTQQSLPGRKVRQRSRRIRATVRPTELLGRVVLELSVQITPGPGDVSVVERMSASPPPLLGLLPGEGSGAGGLGKKRAWHRSTNSGGSAGSAGSAGSGSGSGQGAPVGTGLGTGAGTSTGAGTDKTDPKQQGGGSLFLGWKKR